MHDMHCLQMVCNTIIIFQASPEKLYVTILRSVDWQYPCHNWLPTALKQFAIVNIAFRNSCRFRCTMHRICFMRENGRISSPLNFEHVQNSETTLSDSNCCIGSHEHSRNACNGAQRCVNSLQCCTNFEGRKMIRTFVCVCYTAMRVL